MGNIEGSKGELDFPRRSVVIEEILELLQDGKWREINIIVKKTRLKKIKIDMVMKFLSKYDFIQLDKKLRRARLNSPLLRLISATQEVEKVFNEPKIQV